MMREYKQAQDFTTDDIGRLERSVAWQERPELVESLCKVLHEIDPMGICPGENPHAMTEYLGEVNRLIERIPSVRSEQDLATVLSTVFGEMFEGCEPATGWDDIARVCWPLMVGAAVRR